jgi:hypothetical protein
MRKSTSRSEVFSGWRGCVSAALVRSVLTSIRFYQRWLSALKPPVCRFHPTCSEYAAQALARYGLKAGLGKAILRLLRCHPLNLGGYDPLV